MFEAIVLGTVQGIVEWLPVSSEGVLVYVRAIFFGGSDVFESIQLALFLHLGTVVAATVYFWGDIKKVFTNIKTSANRKEFVFYSVATAMSVAIAGIIVLLIKENRKFLEGSSRVVLILLGVFLLVTSILLFISQKKQKSIQRKPENLIDALVVGVGQGLAALPGVSRSGTTVSIMLLRNISAEDALRVSFILSIPFVLIGNIFLNLGNLSIGLPQIISLVFSFVFGYLTIGLLLKLTRKINFALFVFIFAVLVFASILI